MVTLLPATMLGMTRSRTRSGAKAKPAHLRSTKGTIRTRRTSRLARQRMRLARLRALILSSPVHGTRESLLHQNEMIDELQLERIQNDDELEQLILSESLVRIPDTREVAVASNLPEQRKYARPWTRDFVQDFAEERWEKFHKPTVVTSAVRTVEFQHKLIRRNGNAAAEAGELASPHLSGATIDIAKRGMTKAELKWARDYLLALQNQGYLDVEEEFRQSVFHISVYRSYDSIGAEQPAVAADAAAPVDQNVAKPIVPMPAMVTPAVLPPAVQDPPQE